MDTATTPIHTFTLPFQTSTCDVIQITYEQEGNKLIKLYEDGTLPSGMTLDGKNVIVILTQTETKNFDDLYPARVQVRVRTNAGLVFASQKFPLNVEESLDETLLGEEEENG